MKRLLSVMCIVLMASTVVALMGCGGAKSIVGTYKYTAPPEIGVDTYFEFSADGKCWQTVEGGKKECSYKVEGNTVTVFYEGHEHDADILKIKNGDLINQWGSKYVKQ